MSECAGFDARKDSKKDARKEPGGYGRTEPQYSQRWPEGALWPDSSDHRQAQLPVPLLPRAKAGGLGNPARGTVFVLAAVPVVVGLWVILWKPGWMASIATFAAAAGAARLYLSGQRKGPRK